MEPGTNRLAQEVSPYLVQHADNPVAWWPWGEEAFAAARTSGRPILLSIGYSACHWCHVMAHESFEDESTAGLMNELFVNIKVDREERPDVDQIYMASLQALGQQGGWPLTMFLHPDGGPFWGGTYFPKVARYGQPAFKDVLRSVRRTFDERSGDLVGNAEAILAAITPEAREKRPTPDRAFLDRVATRIAAVFDPVHGGLKGAPKFPNPPGLETLWRAAERTGDDRLRGPVLLTLERMSRGGIFDHLGGGFARYSVDEEWLVPHFEKMLYDNAQLLPLLALAARQTGGEVYRHAAESTVGWLLRDMLTTDGAFAASEDADSLNPDGHAEEGAFYTFTPEEIGDGLAADADAFCAVYDIKPGGNFEGRSIPNRLSEHGPDDPVISQFANARDVLRRARDQRPRPHRDDKVLADWNGLMIAGLVRAADLLEHPDWVAPARRAYDAVRALLESPEGLGHAFRAGRTVHPGFAADHAAMAVAAIALYETAGGEAYLDDARRWCSLLLDRYRTESGVLAMTVSGADDLPLRPAPTHDDAVPNANGLAAEAMIRLFGITGELGWLNAADDLIAASAAAITANPYGHASLMNALDLRLRRADIAVAAPDGDTLRHAALSVPYPNRTLRWDAGESPQATVCVDARCSLPLTSADQLLDRVRIDLAYLQPVEADQEKGRPA